MMKIRGSVVENNIIARMVILVFDRFDTVWS